MALKGSFIQLNIHRSWFGDPEKLAQRLAQILVGYEEHPRAILGEDGKPQLETFGFKPYFTGFHWQLDSGNNWFMSEKEDGWYLNTRYWSIEDMAHLDRVITVLLHGDR